MSLSKLKNKKRGSERGREKRGRKREEKEERAGERTSRQKVREEDWEGGARSRHKDSGRYFLTSRFHQKPHF